MKLKRRSGASRARAQLSDNLLAYSAATAATLGAASVGNAQTILDSSYFSQDPNNFGGSLPSISLSFDQGSVAPFNFTVGGATFSLVGSNHFFSTYRITSSSHWTWGTWTGTSNSSTHWTVTNSGTSRWGHWSYTWGGKLGVKAVNASFVGHGATAYLFNTANSSGTNVGSFAGLTFNTVGGGSGLLLFNLSWTWYGPTDLDMAGGLFVSAIPEPSSIAYGLGLVALGYAGVREHRRRRRVAAKDAVKE